MRYLALLVAGLAACGAPHHATYSLPEPTLADAPRGLLPDTVQPRRYAVHLAIDPERATFRGNVRINAELKRNSRVIWMHGLGMKIISASAKLEDGSLHPLYWRTITDDGVAALRSRNPLASGKIQLEIAFEARFSKDLDGLYRVRSNGDHYAFTQFETIHARQAFPCFDEPRFKTPFEITITTKKEYSALANAGQIAETSLSNGYKRVQFRPTKPIATYLVALAVGPFDIVSAPEIPSSKHRSRPLELRGVAVRGKGSQLRYALANTPMILNALERYLGSGYPFDKIDIVAVPDFSAGAMENVGLITFREWMLLMDEKTASENQKRTFAYVMVHELAHQWFGNLVTMPWWNDIWLNEAFATWMEYKIVEEIYPTYNAPIAFLEEVRRAMGADSLSTARSVREPITSNHDIANAFDAITYSKGASTIRMFENAVGPERFRVALQNYLAAHRFGVASSENLIEAVEHASQMKVTGPFRSFLNQPGLPRVSTKLECDGQAPRLKVRVDRYLPSGSNATRKGRWELPICVRFPEKGGGTKTMCELVNTNATTIPLETDRCPRWYFPNANAAGYYRFSLTDEDNARLANAGRSALSAAERFAWIDSTMAGFRAGDVTPEQLFAALVRAANDRERHIARLPMSLFETVVDKLVSDDARPRAREFARNAYIRRYRRLGWMRRGGERGEKRLDRAKVISFLADTAREPQVRQRAARIGKKILRGKKGKLDRSGADPNLVRTAVRVAAESADEELETNIRRRFEATRAPADRAVLLHALGHIRGAGAARTREFALQGKVRKNEVPGLLAAQLFDRSTKRDAWGWLKTRWDAYVARVGDDLASETPWLLTGFCDLRDAEEIETFLAPRIREFAGGPRNLSGALEVVRLCAALKADQAKRLDAYLSEGK